MGADHASCSKLLVPNAARRLHGKTLVRIPLPPPVPCMTQAASLHVGLPYIVTPQHPVLEPVSTSCNACELYLQCHMHSGP
jgi:hypothetical protein